MEGPPGDAGQSSKQNTKLCRDTKLSSGTLKGHSLLASSILKREKRLRTKNVHFSCVTVYYFTRRQGFTSVPSQGGSTLGMSSRHNSVRQYTLGEFAREQERIHREMLREHLREEKLNSLKLKAKLSILYNRLPATAFFFKQKRYSVFAESNEVMWKIYLMLFMHNSFYREATAAVTVVFSLLAALLLAVGLVLLVRELQEKRQVEGIYWPRSEEQFSHATGGQTP
ncbi:Cysteine/serine-rich nuclear protein 3 [Myotis brandtii]|uniref:Cysteine/serine-rich nuclear protein 3 n=1 Tax=Myotis brandtii TaxID=109478 RepID=S7MFW4_MYOBR|nr:Cysteine/serine-rich nuclear protein 3 [Myotis brandtii]